MRNSITKLLILVALFGGGIANAYTFQWTDYKTNNWAGTSATVTKNATYWEINITGSTNGGIIVGDPFYKLPFHHSTYHLGLLITK